MESSQMYDHVIVGAGPAGLLAAARLAAQDGQRRILILEKDQFVGGRLRNTNRDRQAYSYGLGAISPDLFQFWSQTTKDDPECDDLITVVPGRQQTLGVLQGGKLSSVEISDWNTPAGARILAGFAGRRQWPEVMEILGVDYIDPKLSKKKRAEAEAAAAEQADDDDGKLTEKPFSHYWKKNRKAPAAVVLEHFSNAWGIPDVWNAAPRAIMERARLAASGLSAGNWDEAIGALMNMESFQSQVDVKTNDQVVDAKFENDTWVVKSRTGQYQAKCLIAAMSPWQVTPWLDRDQLPTSVLTLANKCKPVSAVVLTEQLNVPDSDLPDVTIVPAEKVQVIRNGREITFQATIDFELSLQAPDVVKAVKRVKRAAKKLLNAFPDLVTEGNHVALLPVAWGQSPLQRDVRHLEKLEKKSIQQEHLAFCGDSYGFSYDGDRNVITSVLTAIAAIRGAETSAVEPELEPEDVASAPVESSDAPERQGATFADDQDDEFTKISSEEDIDSSQVVQPEVDMPDDSVPGE